MQRNSTNTRNSHEHLLFKALQQVEFGRLTLISPEGQRREFIGTSKGPAAHWILYDQGVLSEVVARGEIGFAESYIEKRWDSDDLVLLITFFAQLVGIGALFPWQAISFIEPPLQLLAIRQFIKREPPQH